MSETSKKVWLGVRMLRNPVKATDQEVEIIDTDTVAIPERELNGEDLDAILNS
jgi:hypothetical protein